MLDEIKKIAKLKNEKINRFFSMKNTIFRVYRAS